MSTDDRPFDYRIVWEDKPALRAIYRAYYEEIPAHRRPGQTLEIGGRLRQSQEFHASRDID